MFREDQTVIEHQESDMRATITMHQDRMSEETDRQTDSQTDGETERWIDGQKETEK